MGVLIMLVHKENKGVRRLNPGDNLTFGTMPYSMCHLLPNLEPYPMSCIVCDYICTNLCFYGEDMGL